MQLSDKDEYVAINLEAEGAFFGTSVRRVELFRGAAPYDAVSKAYNELRSASKSPSKRRSRATAAPSNGDGNGGHYLTLRGPRGKGKAQMSVTPKLDASDAAHAVAAAPSNADASAASGSSSSWLFGGMSRAAKQLTSWGGGGSASSDVDELQYYEGKMLCSLTFIALPWEALVADINRAWIKKLAKAQQSENKKKS